MTLIFRAKDHFFRQCIDLVLNNNKFLLPHQILMAYSHLAPALCNVSLVPETSGLALKAKKQASQEGHIHPQKQHRPHPGEARRGTCISPLLIFSRHLFPKPLLLTERVSEPKCGAVQSLGRVGWEDATRLLALVVRSPSPATLIGFIAECLSLWSTTVIWHWCLSHLIILFKGAFESLFPHLALFPLPPFFSTHFDSIVSFEIV